MAGKEIVETGTMTLPEPIEQRYEILAEVGRGGMSVVFKARDRETNEVVALKVLRSDLADDRFFRDRFKEELILARRITHRNVCRIYDINFAGEIPYISMEFVDGETLRALLTRVGRLNLQTASSMVIQICDALVEAHRQGVIHRDLKPENVMVDRAGDIKVLDFGIARLLGRDTAVGKIVGSPRYMAPEQIRGATADQRTDIYALGLLMYEMLTGVAAYPAVGDVSALLARMQARPIPPRQIDPMIPEAVERIIMRCLENDPSRRFQSVDDVRKDLKAFRRSTGKNTRVQPLRPVNPEFVMRRSVAKGWFLFTEVGYLMIYGAALMNIDSIAVILDRDLELTSIRVVPWIITAAMSGIAVRIYLPASVLLDHPGFVKQFPRLFPAVFILDSIWAMSPILLLHKMPHWSVTLAFVAALLYVPFAQRTLSEQLATENPFS